MQTNHETGLSDLVAIAFKGWKTLLAGAIVGALGGSLLARLTPQKFQVNALLQIDTQARRPSGNLGEMADLFQTDAKAETEIELVQSRVVLGAVVDQLGLDNVAKPTGFVRRLHGNPGRIDLKTLRIPVSSGQSRPWSLVILGADSVLLRDSLTNVVLKAKRGVLAQRIGARDTLQLLVTHLEGEPGQVFQVFKVPRQMAIMGLQMGVKVAEKGRRTGILQLSYTGGAPDRARDVLNSVAENYVQQNVEVRSSEARKTLEFLQKQMPLVKERLDSMEALLKDYRYQKGTIDIGSEARVILEDQSRLQQQLIALDQQRQELLRLYNDDHPAIKALDAQKAEMSKAIRESARLVKALPMTQQEVLKLSRDVSVNTVLYTAMLNNIQQLQVVQGGEAGNARIVDPADLPLLPSGPNRRMFVLGGMLAAMALAFGILLVRKLFKNGVQDAQTLESLGLPVHAQIPDSLAQKKLMRIKGRKQILAQTTPDDLAVEALRSLRTALDLALFGADRKIVVVSGLMAAEGKSFVSLNLACLLAQAGKKVVLVDSDLRLGRLHESFGQTAPNGLSEVLQGRLKLDAALRATDVPGLVFLASGQIPPNPSELMAGPLFAEVLQVLSEGADFVVVDSSPLLLVTDPLLAMRQATRSLVVVEAGTHNFAALQEGMRRLQQAEIANVGFVLNRCEMPGGLYGYGRQAVG